MDQEVTKLRQQLKAQEEKQKTMEIENLKSLIKEQEEKHKVEKELWQIQENEHLRKLMEAATLAEEKIATKSKSAPPEG